MPTYEIHLQYPNSPRVDVVQVQGNDEAHAKARATGQGSGLAVKQCTKISDEPSHVVDLPPDPQPTYPAHPHKAGLMSVGGESPLYTGLKFVALLSLAVAAIQAAVGMFFFMNHQQMLSLFCLLGVLPLLAMGFGLQALRDIAINSRRIR